MKYYKPTTPGLRHRVISKFPKNKIIKLPKNLRINWHKLQGRNNKGKITSLHRGGGKKCLYKNIDLWYANYGKNSTSALILSIHKDSFRSSYIALITYLNGNFKGQKRYLLLTQGLTVGNIISFGDNAPIANGNSKPIYKIPIGSEIHSIEQYPFKGASLVRSAGSFAKLIMLDDRFATIKLPSGEIRKINNKVFAVIGSVSHITNKQQKLGKAGYNRYYSVRPRVRGTAMNAVDHPHGGGNGKGYIGHASARSKWGTLKKGTKTRCTRKISNKLILQKKYK